MQLSDITVPYDLLNNPETTGTLRGEWVLGSRTVDLQFLVAFEDAESFMSQVAGSAIQYGTGTGATITQQVPLQYPWNSKLYAQKITHQAVTSDSAVSLARPWKQQQITVTFGSFPYDVSNSQQPWVQLRASGSIDVITCPGTAYAFANGEKIEQDIGRQVGQVAFEATRFRIPDFDQWLTVCLPLLGQVNSSALTIGKTTFGTGTILFPTFALDSQTAVLGTPQTQCTFPLVYRSIGWNYGVRSDGVVDSITPAIYPTTDLSPLVK